MGTDGKCRMTSPAQREKRLHRFGVGHRGDGSTEAKELVSLSMKKAGLFCISSYTSVNPN